MSDRRAQLVTVTKRLSGYDAVTEAFLAKNFTDRLLIIDVETGEDNRHQAAVGGVGGATRHHFVDAQTRGTISHTWSIEDSTGKVPER